MEEYNEKEDGAEMQLLEAKIVCCCCLCGCLSSYIEHVYTADSAVMEICEEREAYFMGLELQ